MSSQVRNAAAGYMGKRRLCIIMPTHWSAAAGGAELQVRRLLQAILGGSVFDVHFVARHVHPQYVANGYTMHRIAGKKAVAGSYIFDALDLYRVLCRIRPDVVYQRVGCAYTGVAAYYARRHDAAFVWHVSSDKDLMPFRSRLSLKWPIERLNRSMIDYGANHASRIIVQSETQAHLAQRAFESVDAVRIANSHAAVNVSTDRSRESRVVCWIGNLKVIKNPGAFLRLAADLSRFDGVRFVLVGALQLPPDTWASMQREILSLPNVEYLGAISQAAVGALLERAYILVNTSPIEGFPNTFIEAWMRGVPVVSLHVNPDRAFDGQKVGVCAGGNYDTFRRAIEGLLEDPFERNVMGRNAAAYAKERFGDGNLERLVELLESS